MTRVSVNGKTYSLPDGSISVINNKVYCNGELVTDESESKEKVINIYVHGNVQGGIKTDVGNIKVTGDCIDIKTTSGDVECGDVRGDINTVSGDVKCKSVTGSIKTVSGDVSKRLL